MLKLVKIYGTMVCKGHLIIRSRGIESVDLSTAKIDNKPYIPGSTIKGAMRHAAYKICKSLGIKTCTSERPCGIEIKTTRIRAYKSLEENVLLRLGYCPICIVFGSPGLASRVIVNDAYPKGEVNTKVRRFLAINESTGSASPGMLFTAELVTPGSRFEFEITAINLSEPFLGLIFSSLSLIEDLGLGGMKTYGFGKMWINIERIHIRDATYYITGKEKILREESLVKFIEESKRACMLLKEKYY